MTFYISYINNVMLKFLIKYVSDMRIATEIMTLFQDDSVYLYKIVAIT